jgi:hypothetical protein
MTAERTDRGTASAVSRPRWRIAVGVMATVIVALVAVGWWASQQGYVSWFGAYCTDEGYDPVPSYDELISEYNTSPYCARHIRGETWF